VLAPPPATRAELERAAALVRSLDVRSRQLSDAQRKSLLQARTTGWVVSALVLTIAVPMILMSLCMVPVFIWIGIEGARTDPTAGFVGAFLALAMLAFVVAAVAAPIAVLRARRKLLRACTATPPPARGLPARCHLCGAPLRGEVAAVEGVERCGHCQADNVVRADVLAAAVSARAAVLSGYEAAVAREARSAAADPGRAGLLAVLAPFGIIAAASVVLVVVMLLGTR
jgi:hypothetical protein